MTQSKNWFKNYILGPLIVGVLLSFIPILYLEMSHDDRELSYSIEESEVHMRQTVTGASDKTTDANSSSYLANYQVRIWNSGDLPLKNVPVSLVFENVSNDFDVLSESHNTKPIYEFGEINKESPQQNIVRFKYDLLNPKDEDNVNIRVKGHATLQVHSKIEGTTVKKVEAVIRSEQAYSTSILMAFVFSFLGGLFGELLRVNKLRYLGLSLLSIHPVYYFVSIMIACLSGVFGAMFIIASIPLVPITAFLVGVASETFMAMGIRKFAEKVSP